MPKNKDLKRLTRTRMRKTGEAYTTARARLTEKGKRSIALAELAGMGDEAVEKKTGRTWQQWVSTLDAEDAATMPHREIAELVHDRFEVSAWWAQTVTVGYERIKGLREIGQGRDGAYEAHKSKTLAVPLAKLYRAFSVTRTRNRWLPDVALDVRKATKEKSARWTWPDGTSVQLYFTAKDAKKGQVTIQHVGLATKEEAERKKEFWAERLAALKELLV